MTEKQNEGAWETEEVFHVNDQGEKVSGPAPASIEELAGAASGNVSIDPQVAGTELFAEKDALIQFWRNRALVHAQSYHLLKSEFETRLTKAVEEIVAKRFQKPNGKVN